MYLSDAGVGLLAGSFDDGEPLKCSGSALDVLDVATGNVQTDVMKFPAAISHLDVDASGTYLIYTTIGGAVGWRTLEAPGGELAPSGYLAADW